MKKRKKSIPLMLFWSKAEQRRFIDAVERFVALVGDLQVLLDPIKRKAAAKAAAEVLRASKAGQPYGPAAEGT